MHECSICMWQSYEVAEILTFEKLKEYAKCNFYPFKDYFDLRKNTNITHFKYCPECGKKIDWKEFRKIIEEIEKC